MELTVGVVMTAIGLGGVLISLVLQVVLIRVFAKQRKRMLEELGEK